MTDPSDTPPSPTNWRHILVLAAITVLAMGLVVRNGFVDWDDPHTIVQNPNFNPPTLAGLANQWTAPLGGLYVPLTYTFWWITAQLAHGARMAAAPFHALSLLTHTLSAIALLCLFRRLIANELAALLGAILFAVHPVQVEAVAWASGYKDVLCGLLSIVAIGQYVGFVQTRRPRQYFLAIAALIGALLAKPQAVVVPAIMLVIDLLVLRRTIRSTLPTLSILIPLVIAWAVLTALVQDAQTVTTQAPILLRPLVAIDSIGFYLVKLVWPVALAPDYARSPQYIVSSGSIAYSWALTVFAASAILLSRNRAMIAGGAVVLVALSPVLGFISFLFQEFSNVADHYLYLPMAGVALLAAGGLARLLKRSVAIGATALLCALAICSARQMTRWHDSEMLFRHNLAVNPRSSVATNNIAFILLDSDVPAAERLARRAIELKPNNVDAMLNLANALGAQGRDAEAAAVLEKAAAIRPRMVDARASLAGAYGKLGRYDDARRECQAALQIDPNHPQAKFIWSLLERAPTTASTPPK